MIIDNDFLTQEEINGVQQTIEYQEMTINYRFHEDDNGYCFVHYAKSGVNNTRWEPVVSTVFERFCEKHEISPKLVIREKILLIPPNGPDARIFVGDFPRHIGQKTFVYFINDSGSNTYVDDYPIEQRAGTAVAFDEFHYHEGPRSSMYSAIIEVAYL